VVAAEVQKHEIFRRGMRPQQSGAEISLLHPRESFDGGVTRNFRQSVALPKASVVVELKQFHRGLTERIRRFNPNAV